MCSGCSAERHVEEFPRVCSPHPRLMPHRESGRSSSARWHRAAELSLSRVCRAAVFVEADRELEEMMLHDRPWVARREPR